MAILNRSVSSFLGQRETDEADSQNPSTLTHTHQRREGLSWLSDFSPELAAPLGGVKQLPQAAELQEVAPHPLPLEHPLSLSFGKKVHGIAACLTCPWDKVDE